MSFALLGAGCANLTPPALTDSANHAKADSARTSRQNIELEGRLSLRYQQNHEDRSVHVSFVWTQTAEQTHVRLLSPLGQTIALIDIKPGLAVLTQSGQPPRSAGDANQLMTQTLGWPLPIAGLRDWLQGVTTDASGKACVAQAPANDGDGVTLTTRDGWRIQYLNWQAATPGGARMPKRLDLDRYTDQAGEIAIRLVIDNTS